MLRTDVLISSENTPFMVNSLCRGINEAGFTVDTIKPYVRVISNIKESPYVLFIYIDEFTDKLSEFLVYLKDHIEDGSLLLHIYIAGDVEQIVKASSLVGEKNIRGTFLRPLNINEIVNEIDKIISKAKDECNRPNVLVVNNSIQSFSNIKIALSNDFNIYYSQSGLSALTFLAKGRADLIVLDYNLPVVVGSQILEMIRQEPCYDHLKIILTGVNTAKVPENLL